MKILLIDPPFYRLIRFYNRYFPFGLVSLATFLRSKGYPRISVYDADYNQTPEYIDYSLLPHKYPEYLATFNQPDHPVWKELRTVLKKLKPDVVGISIWTTFAASSFFTAKIVKKIDPGCKVIMGGPHASVKYDEILKICPDVDAVVRGDAEIALLSLLDHYKSGSPGLDSIYGLSYRSSGQIIHNDLKAQKLDLSQYPFPDRSMLMNSKSYTPEDMGLIMASRGCPYSCTYCATTTKRVNFRDPDHIIDEIRYVKKHYRTNQFTFKDDSFTVNHKMVRAFCEKLIQNRLSISWECNTRVNLIKPDLLKLMKRAGCNYIKIGVESGSERILKSMNKGITLAQVRKAAQMFRRIGIHWTGYFMMGVPGETEADIEKTIEFLHEIKPDFACIGVYEPFPGTVMFDQGVKRGLIAPDMSYRDFFTIFPHNYYKKDHRQTDLIDQKQFDRLEQQVKKQIYQYNRNVIRIARMAKAKVKVYQHDPGALFQDFKRFLSY